MKHMRSITTIMGMAALISLFSLSLSFGALGTSNAMKGTAIKNKEVWSINVKNVSTIVAGDDDVNVVHEPVINGNAINYSMVLCHENEYGQFKFNIVNDGNIDAKIKKINIVGLDDYKPYVDVSLGNLNVGDVIEDDSTLKNIKVVTTYKNQMYDDDMVPQEINLNNVSIDIEFEKID